MPDNEKRPDQEHPSEEHLEQMEEELLEKIPDKTHQSEEWGGRQGTGKAIATGGQEAHQAGHKEHHAPLDSEENPEENPEENA